ncbi:S24/S26 family peptidase [Candidatus Poribacteria bacterium]
MTKLSDKELKAGLLDVILERSRRTNRQIWWSFTGTSMLPRIKEGDMLLVQHGLHRIRSGDVVAFRAGGELITHRVLLIRRHGDRRTYLMKGDNRRLFDALVYETSVMGRVVRIKRDEKSIDLERSHSKFLNLAIAAFSYTMGCLYKIARINFL